MLWLLVASTLVAAMDGAAPGDLTAALALEQSGDDPGALRVLQRLIEASPGSVLPRLEAARLRLKNGVELERVERDLDAAALGAPQHPQLAYLRGQLWEERGKPFRAIQFYEQAVTFEPAYAEARFRLATLCAAQRDWLKAEHHFRLLSQARPEWVEVRLQLARAIEAQGRAPDSEKELLRLLGEQPGHPLALRQLAGLYERTGRTREATRIRAVLQQPSKSTPKKKKMRPLRPSRR